MSDKPDEFLSGVFFAMQYLVLMADMPSLAAEIARENGIDQQWALRESRRTGFEVGKMNQFIREELPAR